VSTPQIRYSQPIELGMTTPAAHEEISSTELRGAFDILHVMSPPEADAWVAEEQATLRRLLAQLREEDHPLWLQLDDALSNLETAMRLRALARAVDHARTLLGREPTVMIVDWPREEDVHGQA
jgi:hypothetical protein